MARTPRSALIPSRTAMFVGVLLATMACGGSPPVAPPTGPLQIRLGSSALLVGETTTATARDANGALLTGRPIAWSSSNSAVATVGASGLVTAVGTGTTQIVASGDGRSGSAALTVTAAPAPVASVGASVADTVILVGLASQASAVLRDAGGNVLTGRVVTWSSSNAVVASVNPAGVVSAHGAGTAQITATSEGIAGSVTVVVPTPPPTPGSYTPLLVDRFTQYTNSAELLANVGAGKPYCEFIDANRIALDATVTYGGHQTVRVDQPAGSSGIARLTSCFRSQHFWFRIKLRFSTGWTTAGSNSSSANSFKMFGWWWREGDGRGDLEITNTTQYQLHFDPQFAGSAFVSVNAGSVASEWSDGGWYEYIIHYQVLTDGARTRFWLAKDGQPPMLKATASGKVAATALGVGFPFYFNQTVRATQSMWIGEWELIDGETLPSTIAAR